MLRAVNKSPGSLTFMESSSGPEQSIWAEKMSLYLLSLLFTNSLTT